MEHKHNYDEQGNQLCCTQAGKVYINASAKELLEVHAENGVPLPGQQHVEDGHEHSAGESPLKMFLPSALTLVLLLIALTFDNWLTQEWFSGTLRFVWYLTTYAIVGVPVVRDAIKSVFTGEIFSEFLLMSIVTIGASFIVEYPEGAAVMLFYSVGEAFQALAVSRAKGNIKALLDQRPDEITILENNSPRIIGAEQAVIGDIIQLKPGDKLALGGELLTDNASFNTPALTGESKPDTKNKDEAVLAGMINLNTVVQVRVTTAYSDSKLSKILELVQNATSQKAPTELFIRKLAKIYTPIVVLLAVAICFVPLFL